MTRAWRLSVRTGLLPAKLPGRSLPFGTEALSLFVGTKKDTVGRPMTVDLPPVGTIVRIGIGREVRG